MFHILRKIESAQLKKERIIHTREFLPKILELLVDLKRHVRNAEKERNTTGMTKICAHCAMENKTCCGSKTALKYSTELLTINLLYGITFPNKEENRGMCFFLTKKGCCLLVRDVICINFICDRIKAELSSDKIKKLREFEGLQLNLQIKIEEILKNF